MYNQNTWKRSTTYDIKAQDNGIVDCYRLETKRGLCEISSWNHTYLIWRDEWEEPKFIKIKDGRDGQNF